MSFSEKYDEWLEDRYGDEGTYFDLDISIEYHIDRENELKELESKIKQLIEHYKFDYQLKY